MSQSRLKHLVIPLVAALVLFAAAPAFADMTSSPWSAELMWGNNTLWQMMAPPANASNAASIAPEELYIVAPQTAVPQSPPNNDHLPGVAHDHVITVPPHNQWSFNAIWHVYVVLCTPSAIASGACTPTFETFPGSGGPGTGPTLPLAMQVNGQPLESAAAINSALAIGAIHLIDTGVVFVCPVQQVR